MVARARGLKAALRRVAEGGYARLEDGAVGPDPFDPGAGFAVEAPAAFVYELVMLPADEDEIVQVCGTDRPRDDVVSVGEPVPFAGREHADFIAVAELPVEPG